MSYLFRDALKAVKPEPFDGNSKALGDFIWKLRKFHELYSSSERGRMMTLPFFLTGNAAKWWRTRVETLPPDQLPQSFEQMLDLLKDKFVDKLAVQRSRDSLNRLKQTGSVSKLIAEIDRLVMDIPDFPEMEKYMVLQRALKPEICMGLVHARVRMGDYSTACTVSEELDYALQNAKKRTGPPPERKEGASSGSAAPMELNAINQNKFVPKNNGKGNDKGSGKSDFKKLTAEEREDCIKNGKCWYCRDQGHIAQDCPKKKKKQDPNGRRQPSK